MSGWKVRRRYGTRSMSVLRKIDPNIIKIPLTPKYRYVYPAASKVVKRRVHAELKGVSCAYPKREVEGVNQMNTSDLIKNRANNAFAVEC